MARQKGSFLKKPAGPSRIFTVANVGHETISAAICEICGTRHRGLKLKDDGYRMFILLGKNGVLGCCGRVIDRLYDEWGEMFLEALLGEFRKSPLDDRFSYLRRLLTASVMAWSKATVEQREKSLEALAALPRKEE